MSGPGPAAGVRVVRRQPRGAPPDERASRRSRRAGGAGSRATRHRPRPRGGDDGLPSTICVTPVDGAHSPSAARPGSRRTSARRRSTGSLWNRGSRCAFCRRRTRPRRSRRGCPRPSSVPPCSGPASSPGGGTRSFSLSWSLLCGSWRCACSPRTGADTPLRHAGLAVAARRGRQRRRVVADHPGMARTGRARPLRLRAIDRRAWADARPAAGGERRVLDRARPGRSTRRGPTPSSASATRSRHGSRSDERRYFDAPRRDAESEDDGGGYLTSTSSHLPGYYSLVSAAYLLADSQSTFSQLALMRLVSALLAGVTALCAFATVLELLPGRRALAAAAGLLLAFQPMVAFMFGVVNNDAGVNAAAALLVFLLIRGLRRGPSIGWGIALGLTLVALPAMKATGAALYPAAAVALLGMVWRRHGRADLPGYGALAGVGSCGVRRPAASRLARRASGGAGRRAAARAPVGRSTTCWIVRRSSSPTRGRCFFRVSGS